MRVFSTLRSEKHERTSRARDTNVRRECLSRLTGRPRARPRTGATTDASTRLRQTPNAFSLTEPVRTVRSSAMNVEKTCNFRTYVPDGKHVLFARHASATSEGRRTSEGRHASLGRYVFEPLRDRMATEERSFIRRSNGSLRVTSSRSQRPRRRGSAVT